MAKLTKLSDDKFGGSHPNGVNKGYVKVIRETPDTPIVGQGYIFGSLITSVVTEVLPQVDDKHLIFKTENSTYLITY